ncbi:phosphatidylinositol 3,4,5-trisphosphate 5-phosphatase 2B-like isoform X2 [Patiria miniata]|uniref:phosphatidylinositol-3,4,5-trisphosphate 5-phosphatase n=1 Tax=Patiria miniata TaxID=46514 RepID=A0A913ZHL5_PATMI|nr:phosphatidylinositol 3,4,5-trisphosphate 5-phosphatase 2B-like isoform X1 [Patiria miniata]XP_038050531.1 phosphatidylinositol 3,4,5-trisphosphate 5-phosphatase 2B-like isoform X2 [Patiria miniata]
MSIAASDTPLAYPWYHGSITRLQTEECLMRANKTGSFLVRDSESFKGAYVLSVLCEGRIYQYRIIPDGNGYLIKSSDATKQYTFSNVPELIQSYSITNNGLCCPLRHASEAPKVETEEEQDTDDEPPMSEDDETDALSLASPCDIALHVLRSRLEHLDQASLDNQFLERLREYMGSKARQDFEDIKAGATTAIHLRQLVLASAKDLTRQLDLFLAKIAALQQLFELSSIPSQTNLADEATKTGSDLKLLFSQLGECQARVTSLENKAVATFLELSKASVRIPTTPSKQEQELPSIPDSEPDPFMEGADTAYMLGPDTTYMGGPDSTYMGGPDSTYMGGLTTSNGMDTLKPQQLPNLTMSPTAFEVKVEGLTVDALKNTKVKLTVDVSHGNLSIMKHFGKDMKEEMTSYTHDNIMQLIKSRGTNTKLQIRFSNGKKKEYSFEDAKRRETFCQLIQYMKVTHSNSKEVDQITIFIGTWNMGAAVPPPNITSWMTCQGVGKTRDLSLAAMTHDIYVIGTQEFKSAAISDKDWIARVKAEISKLNGVGKKEYVTVAMTSLWGLRLAVLVNPDHEHQISHVRDSFVRTGIANTLGNKGAVGVSFLFSGTSFCFINAHLTSGTEKCTRRNNNYHDILRGLSLSSKGLSVFDLTNQFHHLFFLGDLNYRIEWNVPEILENIKHKNYAVLFEHEQLKREKDKNKIFVDFDEEDISFPPTYRYKLGNRDTYDYKKIKKTMVRINEPSWCDRVIWRSYPGTHIVNTSYGCTMDITTSDHSPVFATFEAGIAATAVIPKGGTTQNARIVFVSANAIINTSMCGIFYLEFFSSCLEAGSAKSGMNKTCLQEQIGSKVSTIKPSWSSEELPKLIPLLSDFDYLEEQHILVAIKSSDSEESYGEFVLSLNDKISSTPVPFHGVLTHQGHKTGEISGTVHVKARDESLYGGCRKTKTYELVLFEEKEKEKVDCLLSPADAKGKGKLKRNPFAKSPNVESPQTDISDALLNPVSRHRRIGDASTKSPPEIASIAISKEEDGLDGAPPPLPPPRRGASPVTPDVVPPGDMSSRQLQPPKQLSLESILTSNRPPLRGCLSSPGDREISPSRAKSPTPGSRDEHLHRPERRLPQPPPEIHDSPPRIDPSLCSPPVAVPTQPSSTRVPRKPQRRQSPGKVLALRAQFEKSSSTEDSPPENAKMFPEDVGKPPLPRRTVESRPSEDVLIEGLPPPLPAKSKTPPKNQMVDMEEYEVLRRPSTIAEWLMNLGLPQYSHQLLANGWDNVTYLDSLTNRDLLDCQIDTEDHRHRMLDSVRCMPSLK